MTLRTEHDIRITPPIVMEQSEIERRLGYTFLNKELLTEALTHPSKGYESRRKTRDNQRMEFLGDAVLQLVLTHRLYEQFPQFEEGTLTQLRARLVSRDTLARIGATLDLGQSLILGHGEAMNEGRTRPSNLADAVEALIAAVYLDSDFTQTRAWILNLFSPYLEEILDEPVDTNPKGKLQELFQQQSRGTPSYEVVEQSGPDHDRTFTVRVSIETEELGQGSGKSKKAAEVEAAMDALQRLNNIKSDI